MAHPTNPFRTEECKALYRNDPSAREMHAADLDRSYDQLAANFEKIFAKIDPAEQAYHAMLAAADDFTPDGIARYDAAKSRYWSLMAAAAAADERRAA